MKRLSTFLITVALIIGLVGCAPAPTQYNLTVSSTEGGSVTAPGEATSTYEEGEVINLVATPSEYYHFVSWTGDVGTIADVNDANTTITMKADYSVTANFELEPWNYTITLNLHCVPDFNVFAPWTAKVENATGPDGGRFTFNFTYGDTPYSYQDSLTALSAGVADLGQLSGDTFYLGSIGYLPFLFPDTASCAYATYNLLGTGVEDWDALGELDDVKILLSTPLTPAQWFGNIPVRTLADLAGVPVRAEAAGVGPTIEALGATAREIPNYNEGAALSTGFVEGCFLNYCAGAGLVLNVTSYVTEVGLYPRMFVLAMNRAVYEDLHPDARALLDTFCTAEKSVEHALAQDAAQSKCKSAINDYRASHGQPAIYVLPQAELDNWKTACANVYTDWVDHMSTLGFDGQGLYDRAVELIAEYEASAS